MDLHLRVQGKHSPDSWAHVRLIVGSLALCLLCALLLASLLDAPASNRASRDFDVSRYTLGPGVWLAQFDETEGHVLREAGADRVKREDANPRSGGEHKKAIAHLSGKIFKAFPWVILPKEIFLASHSPEEPSNQLPPSTERAPKNDSIAPQLLQRPPPGWVLEAKVIPGSGREGDLLVNRSLSRRQLYSKEA